MPFETNIVNQHLYKSNKYSHFTTDITALKTYVEAFEVGSCGLITPENRQRLKCLHKFIDKSISFKTFSKKIAEIAIISSYYIFLQWKNPSWTSPGPMTAD